MRHGMQPPQVRCTCGTEAVSFTHCLFLCEELEDHFRPLLDALGGPTSTAAFDLLRVDGSSVSGLLILAARADDIAQ